MSTQSSPVQFFILNLKGNLRAAASHHTRHQNRSSAAWRSVSGPSCWGWRCLLSPCAADRDSCSLALLLKQILKALRQISRHVSAVIPTPESLPCICLVARVITQVAAISADSNILKRGGCLCEVFFFVFFSFYFGGIYTQWDSLNS